MLSLKVRDARGKRLPFLSRFPMFPLGDALFLNSRERLHKLREKGLPEGSTDMQGIFFFSTPMVILRDPKHIREVFMKPGDMYQKPGSNAFEVVVKNLVRTYCRSLYCFLVES